MFSRLIPLLNHSIPGKIEVHRIGIRRLLRPPRLGGYQLRSQLVGEAGNDLVLHLERSARGSVEAISPKVTAGSGVDELHVHTHPTLDAQDRPLRAHSGRQASCRFPRASTFLALNVKAVIRAITKGHRGARGQWLDSSVTPSAK